MKKFCVSIVGAFASLFATSAIACEVEYVIQDGDKLPAIAFAAYGSTNYQLIFARNFGVLKSPASLPVGTVIVIPCVEGDSSLTPNVEALTARQAAGGATAVATEDAAEPATTETAAEPEEVVAAEPTPEATEDAEAPASAEAEAEVETTESAPAPAEETVAEAPAVAPAPNGGFRLLTANGQFPYSDRSLRGGGMVTELVTLSMANAGYKDQFKTVFIDDRESHLSDLLLEGSFDVGFPWLRPRCDDLDALREIAPDQAWMCETFDFSEPFYEYVNGFFVRDGEYSANRTTFEDFSGGSICRPEGESVMDLAVKGLTSDGVELVRPASVADCFALLMTEEVDAVSVEIFTAEDVLSEGDLFDQVEEMPNLSLLWTVHAVAPKGKPDAKSALEALNKGLIDLKISGRWFRIVARHLAAQNGG
ncbi:MAG: hypothetical protein ACPG4X_09560 [Pikeienuella sp.]